MELKLKDETQEKKVEKKLEDLSDDYIAGIEPHKMDVGISGSPYISNPVKISTTVSSPSQSKSSSSFDIMGIVKWIVIIAIVVVGVKFVSGIINPKVIDVTNYVDMDAAQLEKELDIELESDSSMKAQITHYSDGTVTVDGDGKIGVVYIDGKHKGLHINDKKYNMFGISIGDGEYKIDDNITYDYEKQFNVLDDMIGGKSTATFYYNTQNNDCLVVIINDNSARVVAMTYFNDYKLISKNLSGLDD